MSYRTTLGLLIASVLVTALSYYTERDRLFWSWQDIDQPFTMTQDSIVELIIEREDGTIRLARRGGSWHLVEPITFRARQLLMEKVLKSLQELRVRGYLGKERHRFGLVAPSLTVTLRQRNGREERIEFGAEHPEFPYVYLWLRDQAVLGDIDLRDHFRDVTVNQLRDDAVCSITSNRATQLRIKEKGQEILLSRTEQGWRVERPFQSDADMAEVRHLLDVLNSWGIEEFIDDVDPADADSPYGLHSPRWTVEVQEQESETPLVILIGSPAPVAEDGPTRVYLCWKSVHSVFVASDQ
ncbi:MAG: DUF4340 domain-containing protein, partial [Planctomycetota bacterium]